MQILASQIFVYPFTLSSRGHRFNTYEQGLDDSDVNGWNVQVFGLIDGTAGILDDGDFPDFNAAHAYALELSHQYGVLPDYMDDAYASDTGHPANGHDAVDDVAQILPALAA
jgi:hypothetical protein